MVVEQILSDVIGSKDVLKLPTSEARRIIREFYDRIEIETVGYYDPHKMDYACDRALKRHHLYLLAVS